MSTQVKVILFASDCLTVTFLREREKKQKNENDHALLNLERFLDKNNHGTSYAY